MALFKCCLCGGLVADDASCCPHCGHRAELLKISAERQAVVRKKAEAEEEIKRKIKEAKEEEWRKQVEEWKKQGRCPNCGGRNYRTEENKFGYSYCCTECGNYYYPAEVKVRDEEWRRKMDEEDARRELENIPEPLNWDTY
jgi:ssDNA-binding Zn-finger/Zn-ribbon topoisomerase 1